MANTVKGSLEGVLPMTGLLILAAILSIQSLPIGEALASVTEESGEDIAQLTEGQATAEHFMYTYMPAAMRYSVNNAAYELEDGGIDWENQASTKSSPHDIVRVAVDAWEDNTTSRIDSRLASHHCSIDHNLVMRVYPGESGNSLYNEDNIEEVEVEAFTFDPVNISCNAETEYINQTFSEGVTEANRYIELIKPASEFFHEVQEQYSSSTDSIKEDYNATEEACDGFSADDTRALETAENNYEDDTLSLNTIGSGVDSAEGIKLSYSSSDEYTVISNPDPVETEDSCGTECNQRANPSCSSLSIGECGNTEGCRLDPATQQCEDDPNNKPKCTDFDTLYYYEDTAEIEPSYTSIDFEASDTEREVPADGEYRNLDLDINDFRFDY